MLSWALMIINTISLYTNGVVMINEFYLLCFINLISYAGVLHLVYYVLAELKTVLNISIFTIKPKVVCKKSE